LNNHTVIDELEELKVDQKQKSEGQRKSSEMEDNDFNNREEEKKGVQLNFDSNSSSANKRKGAKEYERNPKKRKSYPLENSRALKTA
jgi:hypothetical protein